MFHLVFSPTALTPISGIATMAVLLFGYVTGLHLEPSGIMRRGRAFAFVAASSLGVPTIAGFLGGLWLAALNPAEVGADIGPVGFAAAIGISIGVTALPVLGAILREMNLLGHRLGDIALGIAAVDDAVLWLLLGAMMAVFAGDGSGSYRLIVSLCGTPVYLIVMYRYVRPYLQRVSPVLLRNGEMSERALAALCGVALGSAIATQLLGLHYVFGAFIAGALMPNELRHVILDRLQSVVIAILMPFFFMTTGLRTLIDLNSLGFLDILLVATVIAVSGKILGAMLAARLTGESWADSSRSAPWFSPGSDGVGRPDHPARSRHHYRQHVFGADLDGGNDDAAGDAAGTPRAAPERPAASGVAAPSQPVPTTIND